MGAHPSVSALSLCVSAGRGYVFAYVPMETVEDWFPVSIMNLDAIAEETSEIIMDSQQALMLLDTETVKLNYTSPNAEFIPQSDFVFPENSMNKYVISANDYVKF